MFIIGYQVHTCIPKIYPVACIVNLIICPMYSYVLYYNIEKSGFNAVSAYLLLEKNYCSHQRLNCPYDNDSPWGSTTAFTPTTNQ
mgnify:CR=1 FL=1